MFWVTWESPLHGVPWEFELLKHCFQYRSCSICTSIELYKNSIARAMGHIHMLIITPLDFRIGLRNPGQSMCAEWEILSTQSIIVIEISQVPLANLYSLWFLSSKVWTSTNIQSRREKMSQGLECLDTLQENIQFQFSSDIDHVSQSLAFVPDVLTCVEIWEAKANIRFLLQSSMICSSHDLQWPRNINWNGPASSTQQLEWFWVHRWQSQAALLLKNI